MPHHCYHIYHRYHHSSSVICIDVRGPCFGRSLWASRSHDLSQHRGSVRRPMSIIPYPSDPHIAGTVSCYFKPLHTEAKRQSWVVFIATKDLVVLLQPLRTGIWTAHHWSTISKLFADSPNISNNYLHPELFGSFWSSCCALQNATLGAMPRHLESLITIADRTQQPQQNKHPFLCLLRLVTLEGLCNVKTLYESVSQGIDGPICQNPGTQNHPKPLVPWFPTFPWIVDVR